MLQAGERSVWDFLYWWKDLSEETRLSELLPRVENPFWSSVRYESIVNNAVKLIIYTLCLVLI